MHKVTFEQNWMQLNSMNTAIVTVKVEQDGEMTEHVYIITQEDKLKGKKGDASSVDSLLTTKRNISATVIKVGYLMSAWIKDCSNKVKKKNITPSRAAIQTKKLSLMHCKKTEIKWTLKKYLQQILVKTTSASWCFVENYRRR